MLPLRRLLAALIVSIPAFAAAQASVPANDAEAAEAGERSVPAPSEPTGQPAETPAADAAQPPVALEPPASLQVAPAEPPATPPVRPPLLEPVEPAPPAPPAWGPLEILGEQVQPGEVKELFLRSSESFAGNGVDMPVVAIRGEREGPTLCLTAGVHGDELNGVEIVREVLDQIRPRGMSGTVLGVPIVNLHGFQTSSRYLPDRRDLNRHFPGHPKGSSASRIAHALFENVIRHCDALIDLHTGSFHRSNLPQIRADLRDERIVKLARAFGATVIVHHPGGKGTLRRAAHEAGIPAIIYEAGEPMRFQRQEIKRGVIGVRNVLVSMGIIRGGRVSLGEQRFYYETRWVRAERGGILVSDVRLGDSVREGDILATITDPIQKERTVVVSPYRGRVIGLSLAPVVMPGYAVFHIGLPGGKPDDSIDFVEDDRPE